MRSTHRRRRSLAGVAALAAVGLLTSACSGGGDGTFSVGILEPRSMLPSNCNESSCEEVLDALFLGLVTYDTGTGEAQLSDLTESITSEDNKTWTVRLKEGFTFHDGTSVTTDSFVNAWNFAAYGPNAQNNGYFFGSDVLGIQGYGDVNPVDPDPADDKPPEPTSRTMSGLAKVSDTEFTVTLDAPSSQFRSAVGGTAFYPMPAAAFDTEGAIVEGFEETPIGNGAYQLDGTWEHDIQIATAAYPDFAGESPRNGGVLFRIYQTLEAQWADLQANELDVTDSLPPSALATAEGVLGGRFINQPSSSYQFLGFPASDPDYGDKNVRQAISQAINREEISDTVFEGTRRPASAFVSPVVPGYREGTCGEFCTYDPGAAKRLWDEADTKPETITITYNDDGGHGAWVDAACSQIEDALEVDCHGVPKADFGTLLDDLDEVHDDPSANFGPFRVGWVMDYPSIRNYLEPLYSTDGSANFYGYSDSDFDGLVTAGDKAERGDAAIEKYQAAEDVLTQDFPTIPLWDANTTGGFSDRVSDVRLDVFDRVDKVSVVVG